MKLSILAIVMLPVAGCAKVNAQNDKKPDTTTLSGTTTSGFVTGTTSGETFGCPKGQHFEGTDFWHAVCTLDDGTPPRFIAEDVGCKSQLRWDCTEAHWECEKGFELDGFDVTWPDGIANISPARCKAKP